MPSDPTPILRQNHRRHMLAPEARVPRPVFRAPSLESLVRSIDFHALAAKFIPCWPERALRD